MSKLMRAAGRPEIQCLLWCTMLLLFCGPLYGMASSLAPGLPRLAIIFGGWVGLVVLLWVLSRAIRRRAAGSSPEEGG